MIHKNLLFSQNLASKTARDLSNIVRINCFFFFFPFTQVPEKLLLSSCHLLVSITSTVRPVFLVTLPAVQNIFNLITTEGQSHRLPQEVRLSRDLCNQCHYFISELTFPCAFYRLTYWSAGLCPTCCCSPGQACQRTSSNGKPAPPATPAWWQHSLRSIVCLEGL